MTTKYAVNWDNGAESCGTFPYRFDTEAEAEEFATNWTNERNFEDLHLTPRQVDNRGGEGCYTAEVIEIEEPDEEEGEMFDPMRDGWIGKDGRP